MFFKKQNTSVEILEPMERVHGSSSPTPSITPSLAPSVNSSKGPRPGFFSRLGRRDSAASLSALSKPDTLPNIGLTNNELMKDVLRLQNDCELFEEQSKVNQTLLHNCVARLETKGQECSELRQSYHTLTDEIESITSAKKSLEEIACAKDRELELLKKELQVALGTISLVAKDSANLQKSLSDAQDEILDLRRTIKRKDGKLSKLQSKANTLQHSCEMLKRERDAITDEATIHKTKADVLEKENNILASRVAILDGAVQQSTDLTNHLQGHLRNIAQIQAKQQMEDKERATVMFARQKEYCQCTEARLQATTSTIGDLQGKLKQAEDMAVKAEAAKDHEIEDLKNRLNRLQRDLDGHAARADSWQEYANEQYAKSLANL